jgi:hypothetical protein
VNNAIFVQHVDGDKHLVGILANNGFGETKLGSILQRAVTAAFHEDEQLIFVQLNAVVLDKTRVRNSFKYLNFVDNYSRCLQIIGLQANLRYTTSNSQSEMSYNYVHLYLTSKICFWFSKTR